MPKSRIRNTPPALNGAERLLLFVATQYIKATPEPSDEERAVLDAALQLVHRLHQRRVGATSTHGVRALRLVRDPAA